MMTPDLLNQRDLTRLRRSFLAAVLMGFLLAPWAGFGGARLFGMMTPTSWFDLASFALICSGYCICVATFFRRFLQPALSWIGNTQAATPAPLTLHDRLRRFSYHYWLFHAGLIVVATAAAYGLGWLVAGSEGAAGAVFHFIFLQFLASALLGLPGYMVALNVLGRLASWIGLDRVQVSLRFKLWLLVGMLPLLTSAIFFQYDWWRTGWITLETTLTWAVMCFLTLVIAFLAVRDMTQALRPVRELLEGEGTVSHDDLLQVRPRSLDEIGYLTQMFGRLVRRLGDQDAQVRAIVDNAAEGIVLVDSHGRIDTFNRAAEQLFGYGFHEVRGRPLAWLMPALVQGDGTPKVSQRETVMDGIHNSGRKIPMSARVTEMELSGKRMYTCLVADISERKAAEKKIIHAESRYRHLVETAHDLVWSMDLQARWTYLNNASRSIYGCEPEQMMGRFVREFQIDEYSEQDFSAFSAILRGKELVQYETAHRDAHANVHHLSFNAKAHRDAEGRVIGISGTARDITEQKAFERKLAHQALHDSLTGLANRRQCQQELERVLARVARSGIACSLFYIDLDQFKYINDTLGHAAGDRLLVEFSSLLRTSVREGDLLSRFGGDEFTVLVYNVDALSAMRVAENLRKVVTDYRYLEVGNVYTISCSIGVAMIDNTSTTVDECMAHADLACHIAKSQGRNRCYLYKAEDKNKAGMEADMGWATRVKEMLSQDRMQIVYQPIASVLDGSVRDYEVLVRMVCDDGKIILPGGFMPAAERFGLIHSVDRWMVNRAIERLAQLHRDGNDIRFSINLSARAFEDDTLLPLIREKIRSEKINPHTLTFEITETAAISNLAAAIEFIRELKDIGCQFALDDFGSGFSSFTYLKHLPVDKLKIDGSFVQNMVQTTVDQAMVRSMNQVAHALGKVTIAEFVESQETLNLLRHFGVDFAQGYHIGKPSTTIGIAHLTLPLEIMPAANYLQ